MIEAIATETLIPLTLNAAKVAEGGVWATWVV